MLHEALVFPVFGVFPCALLDYLNIWPCSSSALGYAQLIVEGEWLSILAIVLSDILAIVLSDIFADSDSDFFWFDTA